MAPMLKNLVPGIKQFLAAIEERVFLTNGQQASLGKSQHPISRNGAGHPGQPNGTTATLSQGTTTLTQASQAERDAYWARQAQTTLREQMAEWETRMNEFLAAIATDATQQDQQAFLKRLLRQPDQHFDTVEVTANTLYRTFFGDQDGQGDVEFFVTRIVERNSVAQIQRNLDLIASLASMYGEQHCTRQNK